VIPGKEFAAMSTTVTTTPPSPLTFGQWIKLLAGAWGTIVILIGAIYASILSSISDVRKDAAEARKISEETLRTHSDQLRGLNSDLATGVHSLLNNQQYIKDTQKDIREDLRILFERVDHLSASLPPR
jgi:hypothetical protein